MTISILTPDLKGQINSYLTGSDCVHFAYSCHANRRVVREDLRASLHLEIRSVLSAMFSLLPDPALQSRCDRRLNQFGQKRFQYLRHVVQGKEHLWNTLCHILSALPEKQVELQIDRLMKQAVTKQDVQVLEALRKVRIYPQTKDMLKEILNWEIAMPQGFVYFAYLMSSIVFSEHCSELSKCNLVGRALQVARKIKMPGIRGSIHRSIAIEQLKQRKFKTALRVAERAGEQESVAHCLYNLAVNCLLNDLPEKARFFKSKLQPLSNELKDINLLFRAIRVGPGFWKELMDQLSDQMLRNEFINLFRDSCAELVLKNYNPIKDTGIILFKSFIRN